MNANVLSHWFVYRFRRLGLPGWAGVAMLVVALAYTFTVALPARERIAADGAESGRLARGIKVRAGQPEPLSPTDQLAGFYKVFPRETTIPDWLDKLNDVADEHEIELDTGDYALNKVQSGRLDQFRIALPVQATYPQIRGFIDDALSSAPALALESVAFKRDSVDEDFISARVVFRLFLEKRS